MAVWLKRGSSATARADLDRSVRNVVEATLADIESRGDAAIRELSVKFDAWDRDDYRLSDREIQDCVAQLTGQDLKDIEFAQAQFQRVLTDEASTLIGEYCSRLCALEGFAGHGEQANIRVRRYGGRNVPYASAVQPSGRTRIDA